MATRANLVNWVIEAITALGGEAKIARISEYTWKKCEDELKKSGDLFYTWQYDLRWAGLKLRKAKLIETAERSTRGSWWLRK
jgi:hypothetical protein